jgi:hypothetical protein
VVAVGGSVGSITLDDEYIYIYNPLLREIQ